MASDGFGRRDCLKYKRCGSDGSQNCNKHSTSSSQSEVTGYKNEDTNSCTFGGEKNGKHVKPNSRESELDPHSKSKHGSLTFPVKHSTLSNKIAPPQFELGNSDEQDETLSGRCDIKPESPDSGHRSKQKQFSARDSTIIKSSSSSKYSRDEDTGCDHKSTKSPYKKSNRGDSHTHGVFGNQGKSKSLYDTGDHSPSNSTHRSPSKHYTSAKLKSDVHDSHSTRNATQSVHRRNRGNSSTLVAYNSTDEELPHGNKEHSYSKRKVRRKEGGDIRSGNVGVSEIDRSNLDPKKGQTTSGISSNIKVIKSTARSTWDSSDSDFDSSVVRAEMVSENENATSPYDHQASNLSDPLSKTSHSVINKSSLLRESKNDLHKKRKDGKYQNSSYKDDPVNLDESQSKLSCRDSHNRRLKRNSDHRSVDRREKSVSSGASDGSRFYDNRRNSRTKSTADGTPPSRKRSRSHVSSSYHSSVSRSRYSSRTESSHKYDRHKRSYLKSKSYSSRSSARTSRSFRSSYSSRSRSSSARTPRRRRHLRSFYRRRHRRRSYSIRSRSRSRSWRSTDSSFSSRSSHSSRSRFSRRDTSKNRSSSRRSRTPLYRPISSITKASDDYTRTSPEHRLTRLGVGSVSKETTSDGKVNSPYNESKSISYIPSVNETVSAAVKRVVGGGQSKNQKSLRESASTKKSDNNIGSNPVNNLKLSDENNGDSRSQPLSSSILAESDSKISSPSVLVDIPLPQDALHQSSDNLDNKNHLNKSVPYIGPQVPPELAKRFGLSVADNVIKSDASDCVTSIPSDRYTVTSSEAAQPRNNSNSFCDTMSTSGVRNNDTAEVTSSNPPEFTIPPEQAELYRPLQEQAKEHALRRSSILMSEELKLSRNTNEFQLLQQQHVQRQLALLQQHQQQQNQSTMVFAPASVIYSTPSFLPFYATSTPLLSTVSSGSITAASNAAITEASIPQHVAAEAMLLRQQQQQQFSALCGAAYPQQVSCSDASQMLLGSVSNPHNSSGLSVEQPTTSSSFPSSVKQEGNPLSTSIQQAQLRQLIAAAALQSATQGSNNNIFPSQNTVQSITQQQLLSQLIAQQSQLSGVNIAPNLVTASLLAAQQQQKQLIAQWQKHALALAAAGSANDQFKNIQERRLSTITPGNAFTNSAVSASNNLASILNASNSLPAAVQLGLLRSNLTASVLPNTGLNTPTQNQVASVAALIAAAQQQQQQQQQYQQATVVSSAQQSLAANPSLFPVSSANQEFSHAVQSALLPQQLQQRLLSLQASLLQQKQQQQMASMNNAAAAAAMAASGNAALLQAVIASQQQQQQQQRQQQIAHNQFQQQQQAALATILAVQSQQRQQQQQQQQAVQDRLNKPM